MVAASLSSSRMLADRPEYRDAVEDCIDATRNRSWTSSGDKFSAAMRFFIACSVAAGVPEALLAVESE